MKTMKAVRISVVLLGLGVAALVATPCRAQSEVNPDFYDVAVQADLAVAAQPTTTLVAKAEAQFQGTFQLASAVECSGKTLPAGEYTVSLPQGDAFGRVTLRHNGETIQLEPRAISRNSLSGKSAVLLTREGNHRTLEAIYVRDMHTTMYFRTEGLRLVASNSVRAQRVPIT